MLAVQRDKNGWVKTALAEAGLMQKDLAKAWDCDVAVVSRWIKSDEPKLTHERALRLAKLLEMSADEFNTRYAEGLAPRPGAVARQVAKRQMAEIEGTAPAADSLEQAMEDLKSAAGRVQAHLPAGMRVIYRIEQGEPS